VRDIYEDEDGVLWIGTYGGGLNRFKDDRFTTYGIKEGLHDNAVSRIIEDDRGNLWMSGNKGVYRVARSQLNDFADGRIGYVTSVSYGTADGMVIDETNGGQPAGWRASDGRLWFPTIKGLVGFEPATAEPPPPPVFIERAIVHGRTVDPGAMAALGPGAIDAEFHYTAVDLAAAEKTRFRYRLDGYDGQWIDAGTRRVAYYTKIPPGRYQFTVIATDSAGAWSATPIHAAFVVIPFWWQRTEVMAGAVALLMVATGLAVRNLTLRRARRRVRELEREQSLERERTRIARDLHDDLGSRLAHIALMADTASDVSVVSRIAVASRDAARTMDELVWAVNARNDTVESFAHYLAHFAEEHIVSAGIRCRVLLPPDPPARPLAADVRRHLYLACKEAVNNAVKHAQATEIRVSFRVDGPRLAVEIADNGRGLPAEIDPTGNGLKNYRERMDSARGTLAMGSRPGAGTHVTFSVPL
jgi:signal transduction histidine kinase